MVSFFLFLLFLLTLVNLCLLISCLKTLDSFTDLSLEQDRLLRHYIRLLYRRKK